MVVVGVSVLGISSIAWLVYRRLSEMEAAKAAALQQQAVARLAAKTKATEKAKRAKRWGINKKEATRHRTVSNPTSCQLCGTRGTCVCTQLAAPTDSTRSRKLWIGNVLPDHGEEFLASLFQEVTVERVTIKRNCFKGPDDGILCGFALILFSCESEASAMLKKHGNDPLFPFPVRPHQWTKTASTPQNDEEETEIDYPLHACEREGMPSLLAQLEPLTETQLRARLRLLNQPSDPKLERNAYQRKGRLGKKLYLKQKLANLYRSGQAPRSVTNVSGTPIPGAIVADLLSELRKAQWGNCGTRKGMAERFLVSHTIESYYRTICFAEQVIYDLLVSPIRYGVFVFFLVWL